MFKKVDAFLEELLTYQLPGNDCIICRKGEVIYRKCSGFADKEKKMPLTGKERYQIFSCSKMITCTAAMQLWEKGAFQLDDPLSLYLPEYAEMTVKTPDGGIKKAENPITLRHLFTMTAGFNYNLHSKSLRRAFDATNGSCPTREVIRFLAQEPLEFEPGTRWLYSLCHDVLAAVVEVVSGMPFNEYVTRNIFDVLGMSQTTFLLPAAEFDTLIPLYREVPENDRLCVLQGMCNYGAGPYRLGINYASGGAGAVSTTEDYNKLLQALCRGEALLKRSTIDMMRSDQLTEEQFKYYAGADNYSYGLGVRCPRRGTSDLSDFGWGGAAGAYFSIDPGREVTILYMQHVVASTAAGMRMKIRQMIHEVTDRM